MSYIDEIAAEISAIVPGCPQELLRIYALLAVTTRMHTNCKHVHDAWSVWRVATKPDHPSLLPFRELTADVQLLDEPYAAAIRKVALNWLLT